VEHVNLWFAVKAVPLKVITSALAAGIRLYDPEGKATPKERHILAAAVGRVKSPPVQLKGLIDVKVDAFIVALELYVVVVMDAEPLPVPAAVLVPFEQKYGDPPTKLTPYVPDEQV
jgi:hypothetical protein